MIPWLIVLPAVAGGIALAIPSGRWRAWVLPVTGLTHLALVMAALSRPEPEVGLQLLALDPIGRLVLLLGSVLFLLVSIYSLDYLRVRAERDNRVFCLCMCLFLSTTSLVVLAHHLGLMWIAVEASTLASVPLVYFNRTPRTLEATWKYLMVCSVGIALALLGSYFLGYAAIVGGAPTSLVFEDLLASAQLLSRPWLHAAFVLLLVGYGTKMGLAPMHTWKPDAYGEAPGVVGALLAGAMTSCAFLAVLRVYMVVQAAGDAETANRMLIVLGLLSMGLAGVFMVGQRDFKRLLAYSSVEHMGILAIGIGTGAAYGALLHMVGNGLCKCVLFLSAGNLHRAYGSKQGEDVRGALRRLPVSGALYLAGFLAITGLPPFSIFQSEFTILFAMFAGGNHVVAVLFLVFILVVFIGMGSSVLPMVHGRVPPGARATGFRDRPLLTIPILIALLAVLLLGIHIPAPIADLLHQAAAQLEGAR